MRGFVRDDCHGHMCALLRGSRPTSASIRSAAAFDWRVAEYKHQEAQRRLSVAADRGASTAMKPLPMSYVLFHLSSPNRNTTLQLNATILSQLPDTAHVVQRLALQDAGKEAPSPHSRPEQDCNWTRLPQGPASAWIRITSALMCTSCSLALCLPWPSYWVSSACRGSNLRRWTLQEARTQARTRQKRPTADHPSTGQAQDNGLTPWIL
jgi:hypothetical protein